MSVSPPQQTNFKKGDKHKKQKYPERNIKIATF